jgi:hypothetical protein
MGFQEGLLLPRWLPGLGSRWISYRQTMKFSQKYQLHWGIEKFDV